MNRKVSGKSIASKASKAMGNKNTSKIKKSLAASVLSQRSSSKQTGKNMEKIASQVLHSSKYPKETKSFAASVLSQSNKAR